MKSVKRTICQDPLLMLVTMPRHAAKFYNCTQAAALNKQEVIPPHEDTLENLVSHLMLAWNSSRDLSVTYIFFKNKIM